MPACGINWSPDIKPITTFLDVPPPTIMHAHPFFITPEYSTKMSSLNAASIASSTKASQIQQVKFFDHCGIPGLLFAGNQDHLQVATMEAMIKESTWIREGWLGVGLLLNA
ncbi:hypothetical protein BDP27DRAFT_1431352 [Rhodocollybia butyracea]|uniref:Uncharacterized protein n=1 Tax=Rhodocollybia butyracea TaxID=206335 RepID=A0A9P5PBZ2_9AGAR|nr:hypothetical protein BDP27DRAFT_1431352 [Rhodocollybia butyracea]